MVCSLEFLYIFLFFQIILKPLEEKFSKGGGYSGTLEVLELFEVVQIMCIAELTTCLVVEMGTEMGELYFLNGDIVHAVTYGTYDITGEEAFKTIIKWHSGKFSTIHGKVSKVKSIDKKWKQLFLKCFVIEEEPAIEGELDVEVVKHEKLTALLDQGFSSIIQNDYKGAMEAWSKAHTIDPENEIVKYNLNKLKERMTSGETDYEAVIGDLKAVFLTSFDGRWKKVVERLDSAERSAEGIRKVCQEIENITLLFIDKKKAKLIREEFMKTLKCFLE